MSAGTYNYKINAPVEKVWEALTDCQEYENWNPFIVKADGVPHEGASIEVACAFDSGKAIRGTAQVTAHEHHKHLGWQLSSSIPGFRSWSVDIKVNEDGGQGTDLSVSTSLSGLSSLVMGPRIDDVQSGFQRMADAMNKRFSKTQRVAAAA
jgi:uncharacterized protein YndB with AHSA1/START domain